MKIASDDAVLLLSTMVCVAEDEPTLVAPKVSEVGEKEMAAVADATDAKKRSPMMVFGSMVESSVRLKGLTCGSRSSHGKSP